MFVVADGRNPRVVRTKWGQSNRRHDKAGSNVANLAKKKRSKFYLLEALITCKRRVAQEYIGCIENAI